MKEDTAVDTYEARRARDLRIPDKIAWDSNYAFRDSAYRFIHHQQGLVGHVDVKLLEASSLQRSYWSALALGPVKLLGLSKAHGKVSSYVEMKLKSMSPAGFNNDQDDRKEPPIQARSPVIPSNDNPVWHNCDYQLKIKKGTMKDGSRVVLFLQCLEDSTATENLVSGMPLVVPSPEDRLLGTGEIDVTSLLLGESEGDQNHIGVLDAWVPIYKQQGEDGAIKNTGQVRVIVSYKPHGIEPRENDLVGLEAFARRNLSSASCAPVLPPLSPMKVMQVRGSYLLVEYRMKNQTIAAMKLHRNAVFVIERTNVVDGALNLMLMPVDGILSTPWGRSTSHAVGPIVEAAGDLVMPALLSIKLIWGALRTTGMAGLTGLQAATQAVIQQSQNAHQNRQQRFEHRRV